MQRIGMSMHSKCNNIVILRTCPFSYMFFSLTLSEGISRVSPMCSMTDSMIKIAWKLPTISNVLLLLFYCYLLTWRSAECVSRGVSFYCLGSDMPVRNVICYNEKKIIVYAGKISSGVINHNSACMVISGV